MRRFGLLLMGLTMAAAGSGLARQPDSTAPVTIADDASGPQQFYVLSFTDAPITEVAEAVIGGGLARSVSIDPAIEGTMSFRAEGWFTPDALLQDYGSALLDQEVALVRARGGDLALVPRPDLAVELARGAALVALPQPGPAPVSASAVGAVPRPIVYGRDRWWDGPLRGLAIFLIGALSGAATLLTGQRLAARDRRPVAQPMRRIAAIPTPPPDERIIVEDDGLVIPRFNPGSRSDRTHSQPGLKPGRISRRS